MVAFYTTAYCDCRCTPEWEGKRCERRYIDSECTFTAIQITSSYLLTSYQSIRCSARRVIRGSRLNVIPDGRALHNYYYNVRKEQRPNGKVNVALNVTPELTASLQLSVGRTSYGVNYKFLLGAAAARQMRLRCRSTWFVSDV